MKYLILFFLSLNIFANLDLAPPSFALEDGKKAVFIDMISNDSQFHFKPGYLEVETKFVFKTQETGFALFDLVNELDSISLNGEKVAQKLVNLPGKDVPMRMILSSVEKDLEHTVEIKFKFYPSKQRPELNFDRNKKRLSFYFKFCDGKGVRQLLESYLPSNLQYDQFKLNLKVLFAPEFANQVIIANGDVTKISKFEYDVNFPEFYNPGSFYFQTVHKSQDIDVFNYKGIKFTLLYAKSNKVLNKDVFFVSAIKDKIDKLEQLFGAFPHREMIIYFGENFSGIEHFGATRTSRYSLGHELFHMYFGRAAMPSDGRCAWIDEGLARWADGGSWKKWVSSMFTRKSYIPFDKHEVLNEKFVGLKGQSPYQRQTYNLETLHLDPYEQGRYFFSHIHHLMSDKIFDFLEYFHKKYFKKLYTQELFFEELVDFNEDEETKKVIRRLEERYFK